MFGDVFPQGNLSNNLLDNWPLVCRSASNTERQVCARFWLLKTIGRRFDSHLPFNKIVRIPAVDPFCEVRCAAQRSAFGIHDKTQRAVLEYCRRSHQRYDSTVKRNTKLPYFPKLAARENHVGRLPTFSRHAAGAREPHIADIGKINVPPFMNVKFTTLRKFFSFAEHRSEFRPGADVGGPLKFMKQTSVMPHTADVHDCTAKSRSSAFAVVGALDLMWPLYAA